MAYGIPAYKLPRDVVEAEIDILRELGVEIRCGVDAVSYTHLDVYKRQDHNYSRRESDDVHIGPDGIHIESNGKGDSVHISWKDGIHVKDGSHGDEVHVGWDGIRVNDHRYDDWRDAHAHWDGSKKKHPNPAWRNWNVFPYPLLAILAYFAFGLMSGIPGAWFSGIGFFLSIPVYYALGGLLFGKRVSAFFSALYSSIAIEVFILLALDGCAHPGWIVLVSIPFVVGLFNGCLLYTSHHVR